MTINVLITGASRGLGRGLSEIYLQRQDHIVIAAVRDTGTKAAQALHELPRADSTRLLVVKIDSASTTDAMEAVSHLQREAVNHLDIVIANAGISEDLSRVGQLELEAMTKHIAVNVYGPLSLFQATLPLLTESKKPIFTTVGSAIGAIMAMDQRPFPSGAYEPSKAMLHFLTRKIHFENEHLIAFVSDPG